MITEEMLCAAAGEAAAVIDRCLPDPVECYHSFSAKFQRKLKRLTRRTDHPAAYRVLRSAACLLLAALLGFTTVLTLNVQAREAVFGWLKQQYESFYRYSFWGEPAPEANQYEPGWIPEGYVLLEAQEIGGGEIYIYANKSGDLVRFNYTSNLSSAALYIDGVNYIQHNVAVNGLPGTVYLSQDPEKTSGIVWTDDLGGDIFYISGLLDEETLLKMASCIKKK